MLNEMYVPHQAADHTKKRGMLVIQPNKIKFCLLFPPKSFAFANGKATATRFFHRSFHRKIISCATEHFVRCRWIEFIGKRCRLLRPMQLFKEASKIWSAYAEPYSRCPTRRDLSHWASFFTTWILNCYQREAPPLRSDKRDYQLKRWRILLEVPKC